MLNLDTHILIHALTGELTARERALLSSQRWGISAIVLWEIAKLAQLRRIELDVDEEGFRQLFSRVHVWPLDWPVCRAIQGLDFRSDPADEIIAATSLVHQAPLVTRDRAIRKSRIVPFA